MSGLDLVLAIAGCGVTAMVIAAMIFLTPKGVERVPAHVADPAEAPEAETPPVARAVPAGG